jgi:hypothetical protein
MQPLIGKDFAATRALTGLAARVDFHDKGHEGYKSAADLGVTIVRPIVSLKQGSSPLLNVVRDAAQGVLVQAKLGRLNSGREQSKWGSLTPTQERLIPRHRDYFSFLLYRVTSRRVDELGPFSWQLCRGHKISEMRKWLATGAFPAEQGTSQILSQLASGTIGTDDPKVIDRLIAPETQRRVIRFKIYWPDHSGPAGSIRLARAIQAKQLLLSQRLRH